MAFVLFRGNVSAVERPTIIHYSKRMKLMCSLTRFFCFLILLLAGLDVTAQQITGSIRGTVSDPSGALVQGATVSAKQTETGLVRSASTDKAGSYLLLELPVGHYQLEVSAKGFQKYVQEGITLNVNETATIPVHVVVGAESEVVDVMSDAQLIQETVTSLGKVVQEREILDLPLNGTISLSSVLYSRAWCH